MTSHAIKSLGFVFVGGLGPLVVALVTTSSAHAQMAISNDSVVFPDGTEQTSAVIVPVNCPHGDSIVWDTNAENWVCSTDLSALPPTVFVTSLTYDGDLDGLSGGDAKCQARAAAAGLGGTWTAWLSTGSGATSALTRLSNAGALGPFRRTDGVIVAENLTDLTDSSLAAPISLDEDGTSRTDRVWTGTIPVGTGTGADCADWDPVSAATGTVGLSSETNSGWTNKEASIPCTAIGRLYCFANLDET